MRERYQIAKPILSGCWANLRAAVTLGSKCAWYVLTGKQCVAGESPEPCSEPIPIYQRPTVVTPALPETITKTPGSSYYTIHATDYGKEVPDTITANDQGPL